MYPTPEVQTHTQKPEPNLTQLKRLCREFGIPVRRDDTAQDLIRKLDEHQNRIDSTIANEQRQEREELNIEGDGIPKSMRGLYDHEIDTFFKDTPEFMGAILVDKFNQDILPHVRHGKLAAVYC